MAEKIELPVETLDSLRDGAARLKEVDVFLNKAQAAGEDVSEAKKRVAALREKMRKTRTAFFPGETI